MFVRVERLVMALEQRAAGRRHWRPERLRCADVACRVTPGRAIENSYSKHDAHEPRRRVDVFVVGPRCDCVTVECRVSGEWRRAALPFMVWRRQHGCLAGRQHVACEAAP